MVKITKFVSSRPLAVVLALALMVIVFGCIPIMIWHRTTRNITNDMALFTQDLLSSTLVSNIENIGNFTYQKKSSSTIGVARVLDSIITNNNTYFTEIQTKIAPVLFEAHITVPQVSQVAYISTDGLLFSYINTSVAVFANSSSGQDYTWYIQTIDKTNGHLIGIATKFQPLDVIHTDWFQASIANYTTSFMGPGLNNLTLFQSVVSLRSKKGVVSLGFSVKTLTSVLNRLNLHGGELYVWTKEGTVLVCEGSLNASFFISNGSICFGQESICIPRNCSSSGCLVEIQRSKFQAFCSLLEVSGVPLRYALMFPNKGREASIVNTMLYMLIATIVLGVLYPLGFVMFMTQAARKEMYMRVTLINQMEATQQAERKSMNKSQAFARASHDIRGSLAGITGLIDLCREEVKPGSELDTSLKQVNACTVELVDLLNSVLDMSKIESGKMQLEEEDFNLTKLLEDVTDFFHPMAMKKGVDIVLDLHDGSIFKSSNVRGDSGKLKQILNNLVSNAVKFTVEGHISIRAWAQRPGSMSSLDPKGSVSRFSKCMFCKNKNQSDSRTYGMEISNAKTMEFVFEVDDTGKGIPMEMRKSVFENYVQVRETAQGQQGTGLGLGIVQSLVRLMGGEIRITEKVMGEKGTCFQFNVLLTTLESDMKIGQDIEAGSGDYISTPNLGLTINTSLGNSMNLRNISPRFNNCLTSSPRQVGSRVVLLLKDEERRRVIEKYIKGLGIKVTMVEKLEHFNHVLNSFRFFSPHSSMKRPESSSPRSSSFFGFVLVVIDAKAGPFCELYDIVQEFHKRLQHDHNIICKVVWINDTCGQGSERGDISFSKPLHGSRLNQVLKMLPEFGGTVDQLQKESKDINGLLRGKRVLVVDDNRITSSVVARKLRKMGVYEITQCYSGKEAVRLVKEWFMQREENKLPFDYIFMDCQMPEMDGYEAAREIRIVEKQYGVHIPIIAVSGHDQDSIEAMEAIQAGMDAFLEKNLNQDQLLNIIREIETNQMTLK